MAYPRNSIGPWQIAEIDVHLINEIFRQIEEHIGTLEGMTQGRVGNIAWHTHETDETGGQISHDLALTDVSEDDHHPKEHTHGDDDGSGEVDHGDLTGLLDDDHTQYILGDRADWTDLTDGGATTLHSHSASTQETDQSLYDANTTATTAWDDSWEWCHRGKQAVTATDTTATINHGFSDTGAVLVSAFTTWNTSVYISAQDATTMTLTYSNPCPSGGGTQHWAVMI